MYTTITLSGSRIFHKQKHIGHTHRAAYRATLNAILHNSVLEGCRELRILKVAHPEKNYTRFLLMADGRHTFNLYINTYEHIEDIEH